MCLCLAGFSWTRGSRQRSRGTGGRSGAQMCVRLRFQPGSLAPADLLHRGVAFASLQSAPPQLRESRACPLVELLRVPHEADDSDVREVSLKSKLLEL